MSAIAALCDVVPGWIWAIVVAALVAVGGVQIMHIAALKSEVATEKSAHNKTKLDYAQKALTAEAEARAREQTLRDFTDKLRKQKDAEINSLNADVRDLRNRLSDLPTRPAGDPGAPAAGFGQAPAGCPGPILYRDTAEALADEAERADLIRINLSACYAAWDKATEVMGQK